MIIIINGIEDFGICVTNPHTVHLSVFNEPFIHGHVKWCVFQASQCELVSIAECVFTQGSGHTGFW